jgi:uncharacterized membrane protein
MLRPEAGGAHHDAEVRCAVHIGRPAMDDMLTDAFGPILREGGQEVEVAVRLTSTLAALHANLPGAQAAVTHWARRHAARVADTLTDPMDLATFRQAYARWWPA